VPRAILLVREGTDEHAEVPLTDCEGAPDPSSLAELSILARPRALATRPSARELAAHAHDPDWVAGGVRRLHPGLAERLRALADRFPGHALEIVAGYRPDAGEGSRHLRGLAIDVRVRGASLDAVYAYVRRFDRTGVGLHREAGFIHLDVRERTLHWIDESRPGEPPEITILGDRPRTPIVRSATPALSPPPATPALSVTSAASTTSDEAEVDPDAVAEKVVRALGQVRLDLAAPLQ
jgi:hypothetical protein